MSSSKAVRLPKTEPGQAPRSVTVPRLSLEVGTLIEITKHQRATVVVGDATLNAGLLQSAQADIEALGLQLPCAVLVGRVAGSPSQRIVVAPALAGFSQPAAAPVDRLSLSASSELELRCGDSQITLTKDGKVVIKGVDVTTRASRTCRVKGSTVNIN